MLTSIAWNGIEVLGYRILVAMDPPEATTRGGIIVPEKARTKAIIGEVLAVGPGGYHKDTGQFKTIEGIRVGDRVVLKEWAGEPIADNLIPSGFTKKVMVVNVDDLWAKLVG